jgi:phage terminase small subunit
VLRLAEKKLTPKQEKFISEYLIDFNATQAAIRAGYSSKTAKSAASQNLTKLYLREEIERRREKAQENFIVSKEKLIREIASIAFAEGVEIKGSDKMKAIELLCKHLGILDTAPAGHGVSLADTIRQAYEKRMAEEDNEC